MIPEPPSKRSKKPPPASAPEEYGAPEVPEGFMLTGDGLVKCLPDDQQENGELRGADPSAPSNVIKGHLWTFEQLRDYQPVPREWVVTNRVPVGEVTFLVGPGGLGKSTLAIQLQVAMAAKINWLGYETVQGPSLGLYCEEDHDELARRFQGIRRRLGVPWKDMAKVVYAPLKGLEVMLTRIDRTEGWVDPSAILDELRELIERLELKLAVIDSLNRVYQGSENDKVQVTGFIRNLEAVATQTKCAILLLGHPSKSAMIDGSGFSGSVSWDSMVRSRAYLSYQHVPDPELQTDAEKANPLLKLSWKKANYAARSPDIEIQISFDKAAPEGEPPIFEKIPDNIVDNRTLFLAIIDMLNSEKDYPRPTDTGRAKKLFAPVAVYEHRMNRQQNKRQITILQCVELYRSLMGEMGLLRIVEGKDDRRHKIDIVQTVPMQPMPEPDEYPYQSQNLEPALDPLEPPEVPF